MKCLPTIGVAIYVFALLKTTSLWAKCKDKAEQNLKEGVIWRREIMLEPDKFTEKGLRFRRLCFRYTLLNLILFLGGVALILIFGDYLFK